MAFETGSIAWPPNAAAFDAALRQVVADSSIESFSSIGLAAHHSRIAYSVDRWITSHIKRDDGVLLIKTSTAGRRSPTHEVSPGLISVILEVATSRLAPKQLLLCDGPAFGDSYDSECVRLGWSTPASHFGVATLDLNDDKPHPSYHLAPISQSFCNASCVINLTKAKTHRRFGVSLASKSLLGTLVGNVAGYPKLEYRHTLVPQIISDLERLSPPSLSIIDGYSGIQGEGPLNGEVVESRFGVIGEGHLGPDVVACIQMGYDPALVPSNIRPIACPKPTQPVDWSNLRVDNVDFVPPTSCSWLFKSLRHNWRRERKFVTLRGSFEACWMNRH